MDQQDQHRGSAGTSSSKDSSINNSQEACKRRVAALPIPCHARELLEVRPASECGPSSIPSSSFRIHAAAAAKAPRAHPNSASAPPTALGTANPPRFSPSLQCLALQTVPQKSASKALKNLCQLRRTLTDEAQRWPGLTEKLTCQLLHVPDHAVKQLKELVAYGSSSVSSNDCVASLVWCCMCHLRGRPMPGTAPPGSTNAMGLAVDLRKNGLLGHIPNTLFGNATWCLHVPSAATAEQATGTRSVSKAVQVTEPVGTPVSSAVPTLPAEPQAQISSSSSSSSSSRRCGGSNSSSSRCGGRPPEHQPQVIAAQPLAEASMCIPPQHCGACSDQQPIREPEAAQSVSGTPLKYKSDTIKSERAQLYSSRTSSTPSMRPPLKSSEPHRMHVMSHSKVSSRAAQFEAQMAAAAAAAACTAAQIVSRKPTPRKNKSAGAEVLAAAADGPVAESTEDGSSASAATNAAHTAAADGPVAESTEDGSSASAATIQQGPASHIQAPPTASLMQCSGVIAEVKEAALQADAPAPPAIETDPLLETDPLWQLGPKVRELSRGSGEHAPPHTLQCLREGAAKVRAALQEFRAGDSKAKAKRDAGEGRGMHKGESSNHEGQEQQEQREQAGMEVLRLASCMATSPLSSQIMLASAVCAGQDALLSSWQFPYWKADFGEGGPIRYQGLVVPNPPWSASVMQAHPRHEGMYLFMVTPTSASAALRASPVLGLAIPDAQWA
ncbi:hypothetical protein DUNSADRAFT_8701 [Dunaliella salina]|uniref:Uncharacterized protein n=1 Tax=Dunaliella salina TaxID=3046 RepID=A0ABQ7GJ02_DUNSA|nr:hypothetical protein DUNSADRAFT_8701 [Dunaliella salina]|eukprot:KAF5834576.1 hypothetical protein DUNSADRAFT_8701 [Dunaliella salina]